MNRSGTWARLGLLVALLATSFAPLGPGYASDGNACSPSSMR